MDKKKAVSLVAFVISMVIGAIVLPHISNKPNPTVVAPPEVTAVEASAKPEVAGASTTRPSAVAVVTDPATNDKPVRIESHSGPQPPVDNPTPAPASPPAPTPPATPPVLPPEPDTPPPPADKPPETVVINLKGPLRYTLRPGEKSPVLSYKILDPVQYEWKPGLATSWQNEPRSPRYNVWATMLADDTGSPYISNEVPFVIEADPSARPGSYEVKFILVIRPGIELGVPVVVRVTDPAAPPAAHDAVPGQQEPIQLQTGPKLLQVRAGGKPQE